VDDDCVSASGVVESVDEGLPVGVVTKDRDRARAARGHMEDAIDRKQLARDARHFSTVRVPRWVEREPCVSRHEVVTPV